MWEKRPLLRAIHPLEERGGFAPGYHGVERRNTGQEYESQATCGIVHDPGVSLGP